MVEMHGSNGRMWLGLRENVVAEGGKVCSRKW